MCKNDKHRCTMNKMFKPHSYLQTGPRYQGEVKPCDASLTEKLTRRWQGVGKITLL